MKQHKTYYEFKCPECGRNIIQRYVTNVELVESVTGCDSKRGLEWHEDDVIFDNSTIHGFWCSACEWKIPGVRSGSGLERWLQENGIRIDYEEEEEEVNETIPD
jgi:predicted RNA-binding Zn-ribbon protein involved in translation (DUF1610 family)